MVQLAETQQQRHLFLCRTPFQAAICLQIIASEKLRNFDLMYLTADDSDTDRHYFGLLKKIAGTENHCEYIYIKPQRFDFLNHLKAFRAIKASCKKKYDGVFFASLNSSAFKMIIKRIQPEMLVTFDDGAANITQTKMFFEEHLHYKMYFYNKLLGVPQLSEIKRQISHHYTIYPGFDNIVPNTRIRPIKLFSQAANSANSGSEKQKVFFIGQPFREYLNEDQINRLTQWLHTQNVDYYVRHPREQEPLLNNVEFLDKQGLLAEDAIFKHSKDARPLIISSFSTVLFNISRFEADKIYVSVGDDDEEANRKRLIKKTHSEIMELA